MENLVMEIKGMHCQGCVSNVTGLLRGLPGVAEVQVSLEEGRGRAWLAYDPQIARSAEFREVIEAAGFDVSF